MSVSFEGKPSEPGLEALFDASDEAHNENWRSVTPSEARIVRHALIAAQEMREQGIDAGDAYLHGLAVGLVASRTEEPVEPFIEKGRPKPFLRLVADPREA